MISTPGPLRAAWRFFVERCIAEKFASRRKELRGWLRPMTTEEKPVLEPVIESEFGDRVLKSQESIVVLFSAEWSTPCRMMFPIVEEILKERGSRPEIVRVDVDQSLGLVAKYGVQGLPTFTTFQSGEVIESLSGTMSKGDLHRFLDRQL